ncbi:CPBP family intramembrane glutamic endopeptidase [Haloplanus halobius]|uniref:CPBP family intramembrane glutamic endopeptidase n=1 Tax=Haloplanus halobius TaxID=2934938 RepID=UPI0031F2E0BA
MPAWTAFAGFVVVVVVGLLLLARASAGVIDTSTSHTGTEQYAAGTDAPPTLSKRVVGESSTPSTSTLLVNVLLSQGLFAALLLVGAWYASIPAAALGAGADAFTPVALGAGVALGLALHAVNVAGSRLSDRYDLGDPGALRRAMTPETTAGWALLLGVVLPLVAGFEELLFRGVLVGAFAVGFGVSPWLLAGVSSAAFALGHGAQGWIGVVVTGALGFVLAAAFVLTGSLWTVVIAHYLVNALEFVGSDADRDSR